MPLNGSGVTPIRSANIAMVSTQHSNRLITLLWSDELFGDSLNQLKHEWTFIQKV